MTEDIKELVKIVEELNEPYADADSPFVPFTITCGHPYSDAFISFMDIYIWGGDDDNRKFDEEKNEYEPMKPFLLRKALDIVNIARKRLGHEINPNFSPTADTDLANERRIKKAKTFIEEIMSVCDEYNMVIDGYDDGIYVTSENNVETRDTMQDMLLGSIDVTKIKL
jgi:hypothetical protein